MAVSCFAVANVGAYAWIFTLDGLRLELGWLSIVWKRVLCALCPQFRSQAIDAISSVGRQDGRRPGVIEVHFKIKRRRTFGPIFCKSLSPPGRMRVLF
ncbi:hypothetical protein AcV7_010203 [Taiwanofungus camphoratus]|nr:hypothetical protein AcV7_010203 [Antrodia cinnamomea]